MTQHVNIKRYDYFKNTVYHISLYFSLPLLQRRDDTLVSCANIYMLLNRKSASIYRYLMMVTFIEFSVKSNQIKKFYLKSVHFIAIQHKLSRAFQTDMHNKLHKLNTAQ